MSRIGDKAIKIPEGVEIITENTLSEYPLKITTKGQYGSLTKSFLKSIHINKLETEFLIKTDDVTKSGKAYHGLTRALIENMLIGVTKKFTRVVVAEGVGYKFQMEPNKLIVNAGFTHPVYIDIPTDINIKLESATKISISGIDKEKVGFLAAKIRAIKPPEPYKGKGLMYEGEKIRRKAGKTGK